MRFLSLSNDVIEDTTCFLQRSQFVRSIAEDDVKVRETHSLKTCIYCFMKVFHLLNLVVITSTSSDVLGSYNNVFSLTV